MARLIAAMMQVESAGATNAVGLAGEAGPLQIRPCVLRDVARLGTKLTMDDVRDPMWAEYACRVYLRYWGNRYEQRTGLEPTPEVLARIWNGGPNGWRKPATLKYWRKVRRVMEGQASGGG
jgi:soluble lytic murein transglycosylase-like protein